MTSSKAPHVPRQRHQTPSAQTTRMPRASIAANVLIGSSGWVLRCTVVQHATVSSTGQSGQTANSKTISGRTEIWCVAAAPRKASRLAAMRNFYAPSVSKNSARCSSKRSTCKTSNGRKLRSSYARTASRSSVAQPAKAFSMRKSGATKNATITEIKVKR